MDFLKNLFTNDNTIIGLCGISDEDTITKNLNILYANNPPIAPVKLVARNKDHLKNIFEL